LKTHRNIQSVRVQKSAIAVEYNFLDSKMTWDQNILFSNAYGNDGSGAYGRQRQLATGVDFKNFRNQEKRYSPPIVSPALLSAVARAPPQLPPFFRLMNGGRPFKPFVAPASLRTPPPAVAKSAASRSPQYAFST
jgi:hypothetical protein